MKLQTKWTPVALQSLSEVLTYTYREFGSARLVRLRQQISTTARRLESFPRSGKKELIISERTGIDYRSALVIKGIKLIYSLTEDTVFIEYVKNVRQDDATILARLK